MHWERVLEDGLPTMQIVGVSANAHHGHTSSVTFKMTFLLFDVGLETDGGPIHRHPFRARSYLADFGFDEKSGGINMSEVVRPPGPGMRSTGEKEQ